MTFKETFESSVTFGGNKFLTIVVDDESLFLHSTGRRINSAQTAQYCAAVKTNCYIVVFMQNDLGYMPSQAIFNHLNKLAIQIKKLNY